MKPFLILQLRPEDEAADNEYESILKFGGLQAEETERHRIEKTGFPPVDLEKYSGVIVGGGPSNVSDTQDKKTPEQLHFEAELSGLLEQIVERDFPYVGVCYGLGLLVQYLGGTVSKDSTVSEDAGPITVRCTEAASDDPLMRDLPREFRAIVGHKEGCSNAPNATLLAYSDTCPVQLIRVKDNVYGSQFHPELDFEGIKIRVAAYMHHGYFRPEEADDLIERVRQETITVPMQFLAAFIKKYSADAA